MLLVRPLAFTDFFGFADHVQNIILHLKSQAYRGGVSVKLRQRFTAGFTGGQSPKANCCAN
ncbi:hypothetical protein D3C72_1680260 [compost metagenome]